MHSRKSVFQYSEFVYLSEFLKQGFQVFFLQVPRNLPDEKLDGVVVLHRNGVLADGEPVHPAGAVRGAESILLLHSVCSDCSHLSSMGRRAALSLSRSLYHTHTRSLASLFHSPLSLSLSLSRQLHIVPPSLPHPRCPCYIGPTPPFSPSLLTLLLFPPSFFGINHIYIFLCFLCFHTPLSSSRLP